MTDLSRRTLLWASTSAFAVACARPEPSKLPDGGPEPARPLTRRGAENLTALAELGAAVRWLHPSDQAIETEWEPLLLDGVRALEAAASPVELLEGLRGLLAGVAPTLTLWRGRTLEEDEAALDLPACAEPKDDEAPEEQPEEQPAETQPQAPEADRARPPTDKMQGPSNRDRPRPPTRTSPGAPSDRKKAADAEKAAEAEAKAAEEAAEDETDTGEETGADEETETSAGDDETTGEEEPEPAPEPEPEPTPQPKPEPKPSNLEPEPRPRLPGALFEDGPDLEITQSHVRGFSAERIRRRPESPCSSCEEEGHHTHAPGGPVQLELPRALTAALPLALWTRAARTLPTTPEREPAPAFEQRRAWDYELTDRGTRLLAIMRAHSLLAWFHPHRERAQGQRELLVEAMCAVADDDSPIALHEALERMLAAFGDGNGEVQVDFGKAARRWTPELPLRWIEERVVVGVTMSEHARAGDVITAIDGVPIDELLARELGRTPAARPGAAIERTVARLLTRSSTNATIEFDAVRTTNNEERQVAVRTIANRRVEHPPIADARPSKPIVELREGLWYVDATRVRRLDAVARRLRRVEGVIVDLRGRLADPDSSLCAHLIDAPLAVASERTLAGPDASGGLSPASIGELALEPRRPRLSGRVIALADSRTRGPAEFELACFDRLGVTVVGSASAGDLGDVAQAWLPGGWRLRFTTSELLRHDGSSLWGQGVRPSIAVDETVASVRAGEDLPLRIAQAQFDSQ